MVRVASGAVTALMLLVACSGGPAGTGSSSSSSSSGAAAITVGAACANDAACGPRQQCDLGQQGGMCVSACLGLGDCPEGSRCVDSQCRPTCSQDAQCRILEGHRCDPGTGLCQGTCPAGGCLPASSSGAASMSNSSTSSSGGTGSSAVSTGGTSAFSGTSGATSNGNGSSSSGGMAGWGCLPGQLGDGVCDCGCGSVDPDCGGAGCASAGCVSAACEFCHDGTGLESICGAATNPPAPVWTCSAASQNDARCDCGCTVFDTQCTFETSCEVPGCRATACGACHDRNGAVIDCNPQPATTSATESRPWVVEAHPEGFGGARMDVLPDGSVTLAENTQLARRTGNGTWTTFTHGLGCADAFFHDSHNRQFIMCSGFGNGQGATQPTLWQLDGNSLLPERGGVPVVGTDTATWAMDRDAAGNTYVLMTEHSDARCGGSLLLTRPAAVDALDSIPQRQALWTTTCLGGFLSTTFSFETVTQGQLAVAKGGRDLWVYINDCNSTLCDPPAFRRLTDGVASREAGERIHPPDVRYRTYPSEHSMKVDAQGRVHLAWFTVPTTNDQRFRLAHSLYDPPTGLWTTTILLDEPATDYTMAAYVSMTLHPVTQEPQVLGGYGLMLQCQHAYAWRRTGSSWKRSDVPGLCGSGNGLLGSWPDIQVDAQGHTHINRNDGTPHFYIHD